MTWYSLVVLIHVLSAIIWVGGILFMALVAVPSVRRLQPATRTEFLGDIGERFRNIGYILLVVLVITGVIQAIHFGATLENVLNGSFFQTPFGSKFAKKMLFFVAMLGVSIAHDFFVGPASVRAAQAGQETERLRKAASWLARLTGLLALGVVFYAVLMVR